MSKSKRRNFSRREFLQTAGAVAGGVALASTVGSRARAAVPAAPAQGAGGFSVNVVSAAADPVASSGPAQWAVGRLREALAAKGVAVRPAADFTINVGGILTQANTIAPQLAEAVTLSGDGNATTASGTDPLGLVYAITELTDRVVHAADAAAVRAALAVPTVINETPASRIRGIFRMFVSEREDKGWFYDRPGWEKYLDMLVTNRFNRFNLSFGLSYDFSTGLTDTYTFFMYPFFVDVPGYSVKAVARGGVPLPAEEMKKNLDTLKFISDQCALRGLQFNLGIWTHNYRWTNSPNATYTIDGLNAQTQAPYSRDAMAMLLKACPGITGMTIRTHGESGVPEGSYDLWKIIMAGVTGHKNADGSARVIELDLHGKTMTQQMIDTALSTGMPLTISCKFWAEHMGLPYVQASIRESEMPRAREGTGLMALSNGTRSFLRYGIGDLMQKGRKYKVIHRVWPGTQRLLLWGDPVYAAEMGRAAAFAGMDGIEYFEPLSFRGRAGSSMNIPAAPDRSGYADAALRTERDWEKYLYTFRLWGRLSYNPETAAEVWQRQLKSELNPQRSVWPAFEEGLAQASRILPLITTAHLPAAANFQYWPEMYVNQSIHNPANNTYSESPAPRVFGNVSSLDPQVFSTINEYAESLLSNKPLAKISPLDVARRLDSWSFTANWNIAQGGENFSIITGPPPRAMKRMAQDAYIATGIGEFFAHKFRAAILWQLFNLSAHEPARAAAIDAYKKAREAWTKLADTAKVYLPDLTFGPDRQLRRHWSDRLADIDTDIAGMATRGPNLRGTDYQKETIDKLIQLVLNPAAPQRPTASHDAPKSFVPGQPLEIGAHFDDRGITGVQLRYRHLHQGERYLSAEVTPILAASSNAYKVSIPGDFTNSAFPIQYYFEVRTATTAMLFPGFKENFTGVPYFVVPLA